MQFSKQLAINAISRLKRQIIVIYHYILGIITFPIQLFFLSKIDLKIDNSINRVQIINKFINENNFKNYLEIGCDLDKTFNNVDIENKVGVDPVRGGTFRGTADKFFSSNSAYFDVIFIDGSHMVEDVYKDLVNSLNVLNIGGIVFLDDILPVKQITTFRNRCTNKWHGDVYKIIKFIRDIEGIEFYFLPFDHGMAYIKKNKNQILSIKPYNFNDFSFKDYKHIIQNESKFKYEI